MMCSNRLPSALRLGHLFFAFNSGASDEPGLPFPFCCPRYDGIKALENV